jgi:hypothetical protein
LRESHDGIRIEIRSDSLSALSAAGKASSGSKSVRTILCELALDEADLVGGSCWLTHIPGKANKWPDALSRLHAPDKSNIPIELLTIERTPVGTRDQQFWRSIRKHMCVITGGGGRVFLPLMCEVVASHPRPPSPPGLGLPLLQSRGRPPVSKYVSITRLRVLPLMWIQSAQRKLTSEVEPQGESRKGGAFGWPTGRCLPETGLPETRQTSLDLRGPSTQTKWGEDAHLGVGSPPGDPQSSV